MKTLSRMDKIELAQRAIDGSRTDVLARRFRVSEPDVNKVIHDFNSHKLMQRHRQWQPHWDHPDVIRHPIGKDALRALEAGNGDDPFLSPLDQNLDIANGLYHLTWTKNDVMDLLYGMVKRSFAILKEGKPHTLEYKEEYEFVNSDFFIAICMGLGLDSDTLQGTFEYKLRKFRDS